MPSSEKTEWLVRCRETEREKEREGERERAEERIGWERRVVERGERRKREKGGGDRGRKGATRK